MIKRINHALGDVVRIAMKAASTVTGSNGFFDATDLASNNRSSISAIAKDSKDTWKAWDRTTVLGVARKLKENVGFVKGAVGDIRRFSVGEGIRAISACSDLKARELYDDFFETWSSIGEVTQKHDIRTIDGLTSEALDVDGDVGFVLTETSGGYPIIQAIEAHCIGDRLWSDKSEGWFDGVKLNAVGRPVAYRIRRQINDENVFEVVQARDFIHVFEPSRFDGVRGISSLVHGINNIRDKRDTLALIKLGIKLDSAMGIHISGGSRPAPTFGRQTQVAVADTTATGAAAAPQTFEDLQGGAIIRTEKGETVSAINSDRPSPNVTTFLSYIDRDVAVGLGVPIEFIWDSSNLGGSGNRFVLKKAEKKFFERQTTLIRVKRRIRNYVIAKAINRGDLPYVEDWWKVRFQTPSKLTVDVGREALANREDVIAGLRTEIEDYTERGADFYEARQDIQEAAEDLLERATKLVSTYGDQGLTLQMAMDLISKRGNSGSPPANTQTPSTNKSDGGSAK